MSNVTNHSDDANKGQTGGEGGGAGNPDDQQQNANKEKKHDSGAADLEKVTDYAEEKEILSSSTDLEDAIATISKFLSNLRNAKSKI